MTNEKRIRALVIDNESRARAMIETGLLAQADKCNNDSEPIQETESLSTRVMFLNIDLPDQARLDVRESLERGQQPLIIFVSVRDQSAPEYIERLVIKAEGRIFLLDVNEIHCIQAEGNYVAVHNGQKEYLLRQTISSLEARLDPRKFLRVHRSAIVKIDKIRELQPWFHGEFRIILDGGKQLMLSRNYRVRLQKAIGNAL